MAFKTKYKNLGTGLEPLTAKGYIVEKVNDFYFNTLNFVTDAIVLTFPPKKNYSFGGKFNESINADQWDGLPDIIVNSIQPQVEKALGFKLKHTFTNGPRRYKEGSYLDLHVDHKNAMDMIIGVSVVLRSTGESPEKFPFHIMDNEDKFNSVKLGVGDMIIYEAWSREHGRLVPLAKDSTYTILMFHFIPMGEYEGYPFHRKIKK